ncbi:SDR family oxidoreductase [Pigmentiphaga daeguensis]|uniref:SDR family oxidoreductase n=1 Tax=Pigmentiphaga daeguensis TaxID=414049 RepID=A0ABP3MAL4_9BURK
MSTSTALPGALVVFGGGSGIGRATAELGTREYARVVIADVDPAARDLDVVRTARAEFRPCDAADPGEVRALLDDAARRHGGLAAVVTTVGGAHPHDAWSVDLDGWRKEMAFNLESAYVVATTAASLMAASGGAIVTTSSSYARLPGADRIAYTAAKAAVIAFTRSLAQAVARSGVRVNCVAPGTTDTARLRAMAGSEAAMQARYEASPQGRIATPEDVARSILFLASPAAESLTGQVIWVNNGMLMPA